MSRMILKSSALAAVTATLIAGIGLARADHSVPTPPNMNFNEQEPPVYPECDRDSYYTNPNSLPLYQACVKGVDAARIMAQTYGGGHGRVEGYLYGFSHGLNRSAPANTGDPEATAQAEAFVAALGNQMQSGYQSGIDQAKRDANSQGGSDAVNRFSAVLNTGNSPDGTVRVPTPAYNGIDNGFDLMQGKIDGVIYREPEAILKNDLSQVAELRVYHTWDAQTLGEMKPISVWDLWFNDPNKLYSFERFGWYDKDKAADMWIQLPGYAKPDYNNLAQVRVQKKNADGTPMVDAAGNPVHYNLQTEVFQRAFKGAYSYYVNYHYSKSFGVSANDGALNGEMVGTQLGKRIAYYNAMRRAFNTKFKESSRTAYHDSFRGSYEGSFKSTFDRYLRNPMLSVGIETVIGAVDDGILQPGEEFSLQLTVTNLGGVGSDLATTVGGTSVVSPRSENHSIGRISSKRITTQIIGRLNPSMQSGQSADIDLLMNGAQLASTNPQVMNQLQIDPNITLSMVPTEGTINAGVTVRNMSTIAAPEVAVTLVLNGKTIQTIKLPGTLAGGSPQSVSLNASDVDPLDIIAGRITAKIVASKQDRAMDEESRPVSVGSQDAQKSEMALYFDKLVNEKGHVPANTDRQTRTGLVQSSLVTENEAETRELRKGANLYKKAPSQTIVGKMVEKKGSNMQSQTATERYDAAAKQMYPARKNLKKVLGIFKSGKRKAYEELVKKLSKNGDLD